MDKKWDPLPAILFAKSVSGGPFLVLFADLCGRVRTTATDNPSEQRIRYVGRGDSRLLAYTDVEQDITIREAGRINS